jgi:hypothetical protein
MSQKYSTISTEEQLAISMLKKDDESELMKLRLDTNRIDPLANFFRRQFPPQKRYRRYDEPQEPQKQQEPQKPPSYHVKIVETPEGMPDRFYEIRISKTNTIKELASYVKTTAFSADKLIEKSVTYRRKQMLDADKAKINERKTLLSDILLIFEEKHQTLNEKLSHLIIQQKVGSYDEQMKFAKEKNTTIREIIVLEIYIWEIKMLIYHMMTLSSMTCYELMDLMDNRVFLGCNYTQYWGISNKSVGGTCRGYAIFDYVKYAKNEEYANVKINRKKLLEMLDPMEYNKDGCIPIGCYFEENNFMENIFIYNPISQVLEHMEKYRCMDYNDNHELEKHHKHYKNINIESGYDYEDMNCHEFIYKTIYYNSFGGDYDQSPDLERLLGDSVEMKASDKAKHEARIAAEDEAEYALYKANEKIRKKLQILLGKLEDEPEYVAKEIAEFTEEEKDMFEYLKDEKARYEELSNALLKSVNDIRREFPSLFAGKSPIFTEVQKDAYTEKTPS